MEVNVERMLKQTYKNRKELLETKKQKLEHTRKGREDYLIEVAEEKQYVSFLKELLEKEKNEVLRNKLQRTIKDVEGRLYYEDFQLEQYEKEITGIQEFIDMVTVDVEALETYLKQEGVMSNE